MQSKFVLALAIIFFISIIAFTSADGQTTFFQWGDDETHVISTYSDSETNTFIPYVELYITPVLPPSGGGGGGSRDVVNQTIIQEFPRDKFFLWFLGSIYDWMAEVGAKIMDLFGGRSRIKFINFIVFLIPILIILFLLWFFMIFKRVKEKAEDVRDKNKQKRKYKEKTKTYW